MPGGRTDPAGPSYQQADSSRRSRFAARNFFLTREAGTAASGLLSRRRGIKEVTVVEVMKQPWVYGFPAKQLLRDRARCWNVPTNHRTQPTEMLAGLIACYGCDRDTQVLPDLFGDLLDCDPLIGNALHDRARRLSQAVDIFQ